MVCIIMSSNNFTSFSILYLHHFSAYRNFQNNAKYSHVVRNNISVNDRSCIWWWSHKIINGAELPVRNRRMCCLAGIFFSLTGAVSVGFGNRFLLTDSTSILMVLTVHCCKFFVDDLRYCARTQVHSNYFNKYRVPLPLLW